MEIKVKAVKLIDRYNLICQEFYFAHSNTKFFLNNLYDNHFRGPQLWKIDSKEFEKLMGT